MIQMMNQDTSNKQTNNSNSNSLQVDQQQQQARLRSLSQGPSRSPAELLARRQQLAAANGSPTTQLDWTNRQLELEAEKQAEDSSDDVIVSSVNRRSSRSLRRGSDNRGLSAEAKLESLSEQLRFHQVASANWQPPDYIHDMATPAGATTSSTTTSNSNNNNSTNIENVYILLAKKDKDLQLAAELGKVLLEKNDELSKANEQQAEQYSRRLELLEEEKHKLRRRLEQLEVDYENRLIDVQTDCRLLEAKLDQQREETSRRERDKSRLIDELGQQSQRLSAELAEATRNEQLLSSQVEQLKERLATRGSQRQDHDVQVEALKSEIDITSQRKQDLERRLRLATEERAQLSGALEESGERLMLLESLLSERDARLRDVDEELNELREASAWLSGQLDSMIALNERLATSSSSDSHSETLASGKLSADGQFSELQLEAMDRRSQLIDQLRELRLRTRTRTKATELKLLGQRRQLASARKSSSAAASKFKRSGAGARPHSATDADSSEASTDGDEDLTKKTISTGLEGRETLASSIYKLLQQFQAQLEQRRAELRWRQQQLSAQSKTIQPPSEQQASSSKILTTTTTTSTFSNSSAGTDDSGISAYYENSPSSASPADSDADSDERKQVQDPASWQAMLTDIRQLVEDLPCKTCHTMINEGQKHDRLSRDFARISDELKRCEDQRLELSAQKTELEAKVGALEELCATLKSDLASGQQQPDEIVRLAWQRRDEAVARKNACEIALAKSRIENMQLSSQLMEVVQQKSRLAQEVAQFEDDMHYMTQHSVKAKFSWEEQAERLKRDQQQVARQRQQQQASAVGLSLGPLSSLLGNFGTSSSPTTSATVINNDNEGGCSPTRTDGAVADNKGGGGVSIMRNFATSRLKLTRFWSAATSNNNKPAANLQVATAPTTPT